MSLIIRSKEYYLFKSLLLSSPVLKLSGHIIGPVFLLPSLHNVDDDDDSSIMFLTFPAEQLSLEHSLINHSDSSEQSYEASPAIILLLQMRKLRPKEIKQPIQFRAILE